MNPTGADAAGTARPLISYSVRASSRLKQRFVKTSLYHRQWQRYRRWFPQKALLSITTEELSDHPQASLQRILSFVGTTPHC